MTAAKVTLTECERDQLHADVFLMEDEWVQVEAAVESIVAARVAEAWDECCKAFAWAMKEEPNSVPVSWLSYVHTNNPYRTEADS